MIKQIILLIISIILLSTIVSAAGLIDILFSNDTHSADFKILFGESENFNVYLNWTTFAGELITPTNGTCNITLIEGINEEFASDDDFTLCDAGCDYNNFTDEFTFHSANATDPVFEDFARFDICHINSLSQDLNLSVQCGAIETSYSITKQQFPKCSTGTTNIKINFSDCIASLSVNITLNNDAANPVNGHQILNMELDREYFKHINLNGTDVIYNDSINLWQTNHHHEYYKPGMKNITGNCSHKTNVVHSANRAENITIINVPPIIFIDGLIFPNGSLAPLTTGDNIFEYANGTWETGISIYDMNLDMYGITLYNSSNTALTSIEGTAAFITSLLISSNFLVDFDYNPFNITVWANDSFGNTTSASALFNMSDTNPPVCNFSDNYIIDADEIFSWNVVCTDEHFYLLNITCAEINHTFFVDGLNVPVYAVTDTLNLTETEITCNYTYSDGHTRNWIGNKWKVMKSNTTLEFIEGATSVGMLWLDDSSAVPDYKIKSDRIIFNFTLPNAFKGKKYSLFYQASNFSHYLKDDEYNAWIVDSKYLTWFDLNGIKEEITVINRGDGLWEMIWFSDGKDFTFQSIGKLNTVKGTSKITAKTKSAFKTGECPKDTATAISMFIMVFIALTFILLGIIYAGFFGLFGSLMLMVLSWSLVGCQIMAGYIIGIFAAFLCLWFVIKGFGTETTILQ